MVNPVSGIFTGKDGVKHNYTVDNNNEVIEIDDNGKTTNIGKLKDDGTKCIFQGIGEYMGSTCDINAIGDLTLSYADGTTTSSKGYSAPADGFVGSGNAGGTGAKAPLTYAEALEKYDTDKNGIFHGEELRAIVNNGVNVVGLGLEQFGSFVESGTKASMTKEQILEKYDKSGNGILDGQEIMAIIGKPTVTNEFGAYMPLMDTNNSGVVDSNESMAFAMEFLNNPDQQRKIRFDAEMFENKKVTGSGTPPSYWQVFTADVEVDLHKAEKQAYDADAPWRAEQQQKKAKSDQWQRDEQAKVDKHNAEGFAEAKQTGQTFYGLNVTQTYDSMNTGLMFNSGFINVATANGSAKSAHVDGFIDKNGFLIEGSSGWTLAQVQAYNDTLP